jgi:hypothetical protein
MLGKRMPITGSMASAFLTEPVFEDDDALTIIDDESDPDEQRFVSIGMGVKE